MLTLFRGSLATAATAVILSSSTALAAGAPPTFVGLDFSDLMKVKVSSVEHREKVLGKTAAAIHVLSAEEIRRSGVTNIPDLLRTVPGLTVARTNGNTWAISSRGGADTLSNKLLVMIDGRSVYTPLFGGVFWDVLDIPLETIERIEVIRGPGGSVWGANAVNGVINIIRKRAVDSQDEVVSVGAGDEQRFIGNVTAGSRVAENVYATAYGRYREFDGLRRPDGRDADDDGQQGGVGFRCGTAPIKPTGWMVAADAYGGEFRENRQVPESNPPGNVISNDRTAVNGANVMGRVRQKLGGFGEMLAQVYFDRTERDIPRVFSETRHTWDGQVQHQIALGRVHHITWGTGFRSTSDRVGNSFGVRFRPSRETDNILNLFVQDELQLAPGWSVTTGAKFEHNDYTGWETQPSVRTAWEFARDHLLWAAVSRAVRTPTRLDADIRLGSVVSATPPTFFAGQGSDGFNSEKLTAYESGYRGQLSSSLFFQMVGFYNVYTNLRGTVPGTPYVDPETGFTVVPVVIGNELHGETFGLEIVPYLQIRKGWRMSLEYSYLHQRLHADNDSPDTTSAAAQDADPVHQGSLRSSWNLGSRIELDAGIRYVSEMRSRGVDGYTAIDARGGFKATETLTLELVGRNLFETAHREFNPGSEVEQSVFGKATWAFR